MLTTEQTIEEIRDETAVVHEGMLDRRERLRLGAFKLLYGMATRLRPRAFASQELKIDAPGLRAKQKQRMALHGKSREDAGGRRLSRDQMQRFGQRGVVGPLETTLPAADLEHARRICLDAPRVFPHLWRRELMDIALHPAIVDPVASILGDDVDIVRSSVFVKEGRSRSKPSSWHMATSNNYGAQDDRDSTDFVTAWIALTPARRRNGCLKLIPGSFSIYPTGLLDRVASMEVYLDDPMDAFMAMQIKRKLQRDNPDGEAHPRSSFDAFISDRVNASVIVQKLLQTNGFLYESLARRQLSAEFLEADAGQFYVFSSENYHASLPNVADEPRVAFVVRYGRASCSLTKPRYIKTLIDTLPADIQSALRVPGRGDPLVPLVRARGAERRGRIGPAMYLDPHR